MKKKIAIMHKNMVTGGAEKALINLLSYFDYDRYDVTLWLQDDSGDMFSQIDPRVRIRFWGKPLEGSYRAYVRQLAKEKRQGELLRSLFCRVLFHLFRFDRPRATVFRFKSRLKPLKESYDAVILYQALREPVLVASGILFAAHRKLAWIHGNFRRPPSKEKLKLFLSCYKKFDRIVCVSEAIRQIHRQYYPEIQDRFTVIYNLQNISAIKAGAAVPPDVPFDQTTLVTVGRLSPEKGQDMIPAVAKRLADEGFRFVWYVVGDGPTREALEEQIRALQLEDVVVLTGVKANPYPYIANCTLYVQPSYQEGFCVTTFEAKILQKPQVVTDVPGMREQFTEDEAYFAQPTVDSLAAAIRRALTERGEGLVFETVGEEFNMRELEKVYQLMDE